MQDKEELIRKHFEYKLYMRSKEWLQLRQERMEQDNFKCTRCGCSDDLRVHHLNYKRIYKERLSDLITLCKKCHSVVHSINPPNDQPVFTKSNFWTLLDPPNFQRIKNKFDEIWK